MIPYTIQKPWQKLGAHIFELYGESYLIVNYYSKCSEIASLENYFTAENVINKLQSIMSISIRA